MATDWAHFDKLPAMLREALRTSAFEYDARWYYDRWREGFSVSRLIRHTRECDLQYALADQVTWMRGREYRSPSVVGSTGVRPLYR